MPYFAVTRLMREADRIGVFALGASSLLVAKFIPGFASIASALAGTLGTRRTSFIFFDSAGTALWAGSAIYLGSLFSTTIEDLLNVLEHLGTWGLVLIGVALLTFIARKWWQRDRFLKSLHMARISVDELYQLLQQGTAPAIIDVRSELSQNEGHIPGAMAMSVEDMTPTVLNTTYDGEVVVYCACPNEASSARVAKRLMQMGYSHVRPLTGGIDAWIAAGYPVASGGIWRKGN